MTAFQIPVQAGDDSLAEVALRAVDLARRGDTKSALAAAQHARRHAREHDDEHGVLEATNAASIVHLVRGDTISAVAAAIDAHAVATRLGERSLQGHALVTLCTCAFNLGTHRDVERELRVTLEDAEERSDVGLEVRARIALGIVLGDLGEFDAAQRQLECALFLVWGHRDWSSPARVTANLANVHRKRALAHLAAGHAAEAAEELLEAERVAGQAFHLAVEDDSIPTRTDALGIRACALDLRGEREKALALLACAVALGGEAHCRSSILWLVCELGRLRLAAGDARGATSAYAEAFDIAAALRPCAKAETACLGLAEAAAAMGRSPDEWRERAEREAVEFERWRRMASHQLDQFFTRGR